MDKILYGKANLDRIVGIECLDGQVEIIRLDNELNSYSEFYPSKYWILTKNNLGDCIRLNGDLHYKYGYLYESITDFHNQRKKLKSANIDHFTVANVSENVMIKDGYTYYQNLNIEDIPILSFDIEATSLDPELPNSKPLLITNTFRKGKELIRKTFDYNDYTTPKKLVQAWCEWVNKVNPSIICGHNILGYDLPYLEYFHPLTIGRNGSAMETMKYESKFRVDGSRDQAYFKKKVYGRDLIDTMFLAYRYDTASKKYDSYGLKPIIKVEGLEKAGRQHFDASKIKDVYNIPEEWEKIKQYAEEDSDDALKLFDLMAPTQFYFTRSLCKSFQEVHTSASGAQINGMLLRAYIQDKKSVPAPCEVKQFQGALSDGFPGIYRNVQKWDVASLYPSIMLEYEVYDKKKDPEGYFLHLLKSFKAQRIEYKRLYKETLNPYYSSMDNVAKAALNSFYGFMAANGLNFNSPDNAALVTKYGREVLQKSIIWATGSEYHEKS